MCVCLLKSKYSAQHSPNSGNLCQQALTQSGTPRAEGSSTCQTQVKALFWRAGPCTSHESGVHQSTGPARPQSSPGLATLRVHSSGHVGTPAGSGPSPKPRLPSSGGATGSLRHEVACSPRRPQGEAAGQGRTGTIYHSFPPRGVRPEP